MPAQTTLKDYVYIPDGTKVQVKASGEGSYTDMGVVMDAVTASLAYTENKLEYANAEKDTSIKEMKMEGGFTLGNLDPANLVRMSNGILTSTTVAASPNAAIPTQTIAAGWADQTAYEMIMLESSSDSSKLKMATAPAITTVTLDPTGTPEVLAENTEYVVVNDAQSYSGWSIQLISSAMATGSPTTFEIVIDYDTNTPVATTVLSAGTSSLTAAAYSLKLTHTDSAGLIRQLEIFSVFTTSGGIQFNFKPVTDTGIEDMPMTFSAEVDLDRTDGQQLMQWSVNTGAA